MHKREQSLNDDYLEKQQLEEEISYIDFSKFSEISRLGDILQRSFL